MSFKQTAHDIAFWAHEGQFRRDGKTPYMAHVDDVGMRLREKTEETLAVAYLHDVLEQTPVTVTGLQAQGIPANVIRAVELLTMFRDEIYEVYLFGIRRNALARAVKIADMLSNLADDPTDAQIVKYAKGLQFLLDA